jgi:chromosome segregation ATPase
MSCSRALVFVIEDLRMQEDQARAQQEEKGQLDELKRDEQRLRTARDGIDSKMRDLGALGDTVSELRGLALPALRKKLAATSKEIEKTGSTVNQKAVEEFGDFIEEQKRLTTRGDVRFSCTRCVWPHLVSSSHINHTRPASRR